MPLLKNLTPTTLSGCIGGGGEKRCKAKRKPNRSVCTMTNITHSMRCTFKITFDRLVCSSEHPSIRQYFQKNQSRLPQTWHHSLKRPLCRMLIAAIEVSLVSWKSFNKLAPFKCLPKSIIHAIPITSTKCNAIAYIQISVLMHWGCLENRNCSILQSLCSLYPLVSNWCHLVVMEQYFRNVCWVANLMQLTISALPLQHGRQYSRKCCGKVTSHIRLFRLMVRNGKYVHKGLVQKCLIARI